MKKRVVPVIVNNNNMEGATASTSAAAIIAAGSTHKRSRKSLCHVPSPNPAESSSSSSLPQETLSSLICFDDRSRHEFVEQTTKET